jgi:hypothetical protein
MTEILFILTTLYVAYVFYNAINDTKPPMPARPAQKIDSVMPTETATVVAETPVDTATEVDEPIAAEIEEEHYDSSAANQVKNLRNPLTGEISKANVGYLFTKRWIKEALVTEGLLERIYANTELNPELNVKVKQALATLKTLPQYQV